MLHKYNIRRLLLMPKLDAAWHVFSSILMIIDIFICSRVPPGVVNVVPFVDEESFQTIACLFPRVIGIIPQTISPSDDFHFSNGTNFLKLKFVLRVIKRMMQKEG